MTKGTLLELNRSKNRRVARAATAETTGHNAACCRRLCGLTHWGLSPNFWCLRSTITCLTAISPSRRFQSIPLTRPACTHRGHMSVGELFILGFFGKAIPTWLRQFAARYGLGGVILFDYSCQTRPYDKHIES